MSVPRIRTIKGNLTNLLSITDYKSVNALMKAQPELKTRKLAEQYLLDNWNEFADIMEENERQEKQIQKKKLKVYKQEARKEAKDFFKNSFKIEDETIKRSKPAVKETKRFKTASKELKITNANYNGFESLRVLNNSIPTLRETLKEYKIISQIVSLLTCLNLFCPSFPTINII